MSKLYKRIQLNTSNHFLSVLPPTAIEWRAGRHLIFVFSLFINESVIISR